MKTYLTIFYCLLIVISNSQVNYVNNFDGAITSNPLPVSIVSNTTNIWQIGKPQKVLFNSASTIPNVMITDTTNYYPNNNISQFIVTVLNTYTANPWPLALQWQQKLNMDSKKDGGIVEFSTNSGSTWQNAQNNTNVYQYYGFQPINKDTINGNEYCFSGTDNIWRDIWLCLKPTVANSNDTVLFKFTFKSDSINTNKEGWMIDNMNAHTTIFHPVKEISQIDELVVYPNLTNGIVNVELRKTSPSDVIDNIDLVTVDGKIIERFGLNYTKVVIDLSKHLPGIYYLKVTANKKTKLHKIIYEKN